MAYTYAKLAQERTMHEITDAEFAAKTAKGVTLVDFFAEWCGPCHMQTPILEELAEEMSGKANIVKVDIDRSQATAAKYQITSVPTLILFKDGKEFKRVVGLRDADALRALISSALT
ncbi:MAG: thioredoxin [Parachlamydiales bacterium]